jgi:hypothetical protein
MLASPEPPSFEARRKGGAHLRMTSACVARQSWFDRRRHVHHRSFSVERPASASITEMIQNRITICGSVQPFCSKW